MTDSVPIAFQPPRTDVVTAAVMPIDGFSRAPLRAGVEAWLWDTERDQARPFQLVRNLSGHFVLLNQPRDADYTFRVDATAARYRGPIDVTFNPSVDGIGFVVRLERRPDFEFESATTLVRGVVVRTGGNGSPGTLRPIEGATVSVPAAQANQPPSFTTTTDDRGAFALALRVVLSNPQEPETPADTTFRFEADGEGSRTLTRAVTDGRTHVFDESVDLDGTNDPQFGP